MHIERWRGNSSGRSQIVVYANTVWTVATAADASADFEAQVTDSLHMLEAHLKEAGSRRTHLLSLQVLLTDIQNRPSFDRIWQDWIGPNPEHWPQRACYQAALAPGLLVELIAVAALASASQSSIGPS